MTDTNPSSSTQKSKWIGILALFAALTTLGLVVGYLVYAEDEIDVSKDETKASFLQVSVEAVTASTHPVRVEAYSAVKPRWSADITAAVAGRVLEVADKALAGERVKMGTILARIEPSRYEAELAAANLALKQAELSLWQAENAHILAKRQFKRDGRKAPNDLALKLPQLDIAKASLAQAKVRVKAAEQQVEDTVISAPFSGFITNRLVSPGQSVNMGEKLLRLVDDRVFELEAQLGSADWALLAHPLKGKEANILAEGGEVVAKAKVREAAGFLDEKTRQHKIFLEVDAKANQVLLSGDFLKLSLPGHDIDEALSIPESARTQEGYIWFIDEENQLQRSLPKVIYRHAGRIIIKVPKGGSQTTTWRVATIPLASFLPGQTVEPIDKRAAVLKGEGNK